jgi:heterotetrameric sarcosine oxidase gamma subunit
VLCEPGQTAELREHLGTDAVDLTSALAALTIAGPLAPELFARFTAIDLRPHVTPIHGFRPGSVARTPGAILREAEDRWLMLFGAALGSYVWTVVADAAASLGGGPVGSEAFAEVAASA